MTNTARKPSFMVGFSTGWDYPQNTDPSDSPGAHRLLIEMAASWMALEKGVTDRIVETYRDLQVSGEESKTLELPVLMKELYDVVSDERLIVSKNGDFCFEANLDNDEKCKGSIAMADCEKGAKALAKLYEEMPENGSGLFTMAHLCGEEELEGLSETVEDQQEVEADRGTIWINGKNVYGAVNAKDSDTHAVAVDGHMYKVGSKMCKPYRDFDNDLDTGFSVP